MILNETLDTQKLAAIVISKKGYTLTEEIDMDDVDNSVLYIAANDRNEFYANSCISLLGLIELGEIRNENWRLNAQEMNYTLSVKDKMYD
jgi:hypothetical protein